MNQSLFDIANLPYDVLIQIVDKLDGQDLGKLSMMNRMWHSVMSDLNLWEMVCVKKQRWHGAIMDLKRFKNWKEVYVQLYCIENAMCAHCFKRSIPHRCKTIEDNSEVTVEQLSSAYSIPLCRWFPHKEMSKNQKETEACY